MVDQEKKESDETPKADSGESPQLDSTPETEATSDTEGEAVSDACDSAQSEDLEEGAEDLEATEVVLLKEQLEHLTTKLQDVEAQLNEAQKDVNYAKAETQTALRRGREETNRSVNRVKRELMTRLISVADTFLHTSKDLETLEKDERTELIVSAVDMALKEFDKVVAGEGLERSEPYGEVFDPQYHEAAAMVPSAEHEPGTVMDVLRVGYMLNGNVLRPPQVVVAQAPPEASAETGAED